ncbi:hypothetical protein TrST_g12684 [Triparma strigata]|uniref:Uncharacterized protein n=1 Tax=Triparma strigata TaxID=1606541 RepID=A0A9W7BX70_9STRA|nr:hypothetical protein TrST_g12684 [Triparma strigata]
MADLYPASISRFLRDPSAKASKLPNFVSPPPVPVPPPVGSLGCLSMNSSGGGKDHGMDEFEQRMFKGIQLILFRNLHRAETEGVQEPEMNRTWLAYMNDALHLVWVSKNLSHAESKMESVNLSRVVDVDEDIVKLISVSVTEVTCRLVSLRTPTQRFGLGVVCKEDFDSLMKCMRKCVSLSTRMAAANTKNYSGRRQSLLMEKFSPEDMLMIGRQGGSASDNQSRYMAGSSSYNMKRRGSHGTISISSSDNGSYDGHADHSGGGETGRKDLVDLEPVKENRTESGASADILQSDSASSESEDELVQRQAPLSEGKNSSSEPVKTVKRPSVEELAKKASQYAQKLETKRTSKDPIRPPPPPVVVKSPEPPPPPAATPPGDTIKATGFKLTSPSTWKTKRGGSNADSMRISENSAVEVQPEKDRGSLGKMSARISQLSTFSNFKKAGAKKPSGGRGPGRRKQSAKSTGGVWNNYVEKTKKEGGAGGVDGAGVAPSKEG